MAIQKLEEAAGTGMPLARRDRWLTPQEMRDAYAKIYPDRSPGQWDTNFQEKKAMPPEAVDAELGRDMEETYKYLDREFAFPHLGERVHNTFEGLSAHFWNIAFRAAMMGLPLEVRQLALIHSIPEHKGRGILEARRTIQKLKAEFGNEVGTNLESLLFTEGVIVDHLFHTLRKGGVDVERKTIDYLKERLAGVRDAYPPQQLERALKDAMSLSPNSPGRLARPIPEGDMPLHIETRARLHAPYAKRLYEDDYGQLARRDPVRNPSAHHDHAILIVKGLCFTDRLRTANDSTIERVSREAMDFIPCLDEMLGELHLRDGHGRGTNRLVNNPVEFVTSTLKTELLREMGTIGNYVSGRRESSFQQLAAVLAQRQNQALMAYGRTAKEMGYEPARIRTQPSSPSARS